MEILQGAINRDNYYSVKESAEILGVTTKTIRNRIEAKTLEALWYEVGKGQSQWLISKEVIKAIVDSKESKFSHAISIPHNLIEEIRNQIKAENQTLLQELAEIRIGQQEIAVSQERLEKSLLERDTKILEIIRERQIEKIESSKSFWQKLFGN